MEMDKLNKWLALFANVGVLIGIVFLVLEMNQNTAMMRAQTRDSMTEKQMLFLSGILADAEVQRNFLAALELPAEENIATSQARNLFRTQLRMWENEWYQYEQGMFEDEEFEPRLTLWSTLLISQPYRDFWATVRETFSPSFRTQIDNIIENIQAAAD